MTSNYLRARKLIRIAPRCLLIAAAAAVQAVKPKRAEAAKAVDLGEDRFLRAVEVKDPASDRGGRRIITGKCIAVMKMLAGSLYMLAA